MVTAAAAAISVTTVAILFITGRPGSVTDPLGAAVALVSSGKSSNVLVHERQQLILQDAPTQAFSVTSAPKISTSPAPAQPAQVATAPVATRASGPPPSSPSAPGSADGIRPSFVFDP